MPVYRIRRCSGRKGGSNFYHHADVVAPHWATALKAAREHRVTNWRWIDTFDVAPEDYEVFEFLYPVRNDARNPREPKPAPAAARRPAKKKTARTRRAA